MEFSKFLKDESGAATVDWVVLTAAMTGIGIATLMTVSGGIQNLSGDINTQLRSQTIVTSFGPDAITSFFATDIAGWTVTGSGRQSEISHSTGAGSDGEPGFMLFTDSSGGYSWLGLPDTFSGDQSDKYGGSLSYDLTLISGSSFADGPPIMKLTGANGDVLQYTDDTRPSTGSWTTYSADLSEGSWTKSDGSVATEDEIKGVLENVQSSELRVEYINGSEQIGVDNVQLNGS